MKSKSKKRKNTQPSTNRRMPNYSPANLTCNSCESDAMEFHPLRDRWIPFQRRNGDLYLGSRPHKFLQGEDWKVYIVDLQLKHNQRRQRLLHAKFSSSHFPVEVTIRIHLVWSRSIHNSRRLEVKSIIDLHLQQANYWRPGECFRKTQVTPQGFGPRWKLRSDNQQDLSLVGVPVESDKMVNIKSANLMKRNWHLILLCIKDEEYRSTHNFRDNCNQAIYIKMNTNCKIYISRSHHRNFWNKNNTRRHVHEQMPSSGKSVTRYTLIPCFKTTISNNV